VTSVCIAGAGVIGSLLAGHLAQVADVSVLARREEHARALNEDGLRVSGRSSRTVRVTAAVDPAALPEPELVIVACKGTDLDTVARRLEGHWPRATVMTIQNGLGAEEIVARHGDWPLLSEYILDTPTWIGPYRDTTPADARNVAGLVVSAGLKAEAFDDLRPIQWSKLIFNATVNAVAALTGLPHDHHFAEGLLGELVHALVDEGKAVARAAGVELREDPWEMNVLATRRGNAHYPSMLEDVEAGRPTEIELITGALVREADRHAVPVPLHTALYRLVKAKEAGYSA